MLQIVSLVLSSHRNIRDHVGMLNWRFKNAYTSALVAKIMGSVIAKKVKIYSNETWFKYFTQISFHPLQKELIDNLNTALSKLLIVMTHRHDMNMYYGNRSAGWWARVKENEILFLQLSIIDIGGCVSKCVKIFHSLFCRSRLYFNHI